MSALFDHPLMNPERVSKHFKDDSAKMLCPDLGLAMYIQVLSLALERTSSVQGQVYLVSNDIERYFAIAANLLKISPSQDGI